MYTDLRVFPCGDDFEEPAGLAILAVIVFKGVPSWQTDSLFFFH